MLSLLEYYKICNEPRRKEFLEMFFFAFHACGLRVVDVMTLQWSSFLRLGIAQYAFKFAHERIAVLVGEYMRMHDLVHYPL